MNRKKLLSLLLALVMVLSAFPISAFAAPASDIPDKMLDNPIVRALAYTGYNVQKQKDNGTIYQTGHYGGALKRNAPSILSDIHYPLEREIQGRCHYKQNLCVRLYQQEN